ncbi:MAG: CTP synthase [Alphaproteobacteria bacterium]|nr:CTP synthase [Alphaproteobacteria bacterium]
MTRFIFITGGVVSSLGKGLASASLAAILQARGFKVRLRKLDPYLNVDPGTMSPYQHGEVYVTDDGAETDLDLGNYERFTGVDSRQSDNVTTGSIYSEVIRRERKGKYLGATVQVIPHITDAIKEFITKDITDEDFILCEIGGTVGDIESLPFLEAIRQLANDLGQGNSMFLHLTLLPYIATAGELKTKPTQHSVKELLSVGIQPDILLCRSDRPIPEDERKKIALFCNIQSERVIAALDVDTSIYQVPISYHHEGLDTEVCKHFALPHESDNNLLSKWQQVVETVKTPKDTVNIAVVGKYTSFPDAYKSLNEALGHGGIANNVKVRVNWMDSEIFESEDPSRYLTNIDGILVPGGFGERGAEGKIAAAGYARNTDIPYFGICFGMQMAVIESTRTLCGIQSANSTEFFPTEEPVIGLMTEWDKDGIHETRNEDSDKGGTMRLGAYPCTLRPGSRVHEIYGVNEISERHRHRYEMNLEYEEMLSEKGVIISGKSPDGRLPEIIEIPDHPWFIGVQFHPELKSRPFEPHPLFASFIEAAVKNAVKRRKEE